MTAPPPTEADGARARVPPQRAPRRILVAGSSGSGKTTLAQRIAAALDIPHVELDSLFHGPGWTRLPDFEEQVRGLVAQPAWVTEWQYTQARPLLARSADLLVWLDLPRAVAMRQVVARTVSRRLRRTALWNGNVEGPLWRAVACRDGIIRWAWRTYHPTRELVCGLSGQRPDLPIVRLTSHPQADAWVEQLAGGAQARADDLRDAAVIGHSGEMSSNSAIPPGEAFQDHYPDDVAACFGCGRLNPDGHHIRTTWDGDRTVTRFTPAPEQTAVPGYVYGGLIASLVDCSGTGSAAGAAYRAAGRTMGDPNDTEPPLRFVTGRLEVDYLAPTPMGVELVVRGQIEEITDRKVVVALTVTAADTGADTVVARGRVVAVRLPPTMGA